VGAEIPDVPEGWPTADPAAIVRAKSDGGIRALIARAMWRRDYQPGPEANIGGMVYEVADRVAAHALPEIERRIREQVAQDLLAVDPVDWALAGQRAGQDAAQIALGERDRWLIVRSEG
jgi:hypothetical protein